MAHRVVRCACGQEMRVPLETLHRYGKCVACESRLKITEHNSRVEGAEAEEEAARIGKGCVRCGKAFQGHWDQVATPLGTMCLVCGRQPEAFALPAPEEPDPVFFEGAVEPIRTARWSVIQKEPARKEPPSRTEVLVFCAVAVVAILLIVFLPVEEYAAEFFNPAPVAINELQPWQIAVVYVTDGLADILGITFTLWLALAMCGMLPSEFWDENAKAIFVAAIALYLVSLIPLFVIVILLQSYLLWWMFGLGLAQVPAIILAAIVGGIAGKLLDAFAMGFVAAAFT